MLRLVPRAVTAPLETGASPEVQREHARLLREGWRYLGKGEYRK